VPYSSIIKILLAEVLSQNPKCRTERKKVSGEKKSPIANCSRRPINVFTRKRETIWREGKGNRQLSIADLGMMEPTAACLYGVVSGVSATIPRKHILCFRGKLENIFDVPDRLPIIFNNILGTSRRGYNLQFTVYHSPFTIHKLFTIHWSNIWKLQLLVQDMSDWLRDLLRGNGEFRPLCGCRPGKIKKTEEFRAAYLWTRAGSSFSKKHS